MGVLPELGQGMGPEPGTLPSRSPGTDVCFQASASSRPSQTQGSRRGRGRGCSGLRQGISGRRRRPACHPPPAEGRIGSPRLGPPSAPAAGLLPLQPAARPACPSPGPGGQVPRSPGPQEPPGRGLSVPPASSSDVNVSRRRGKRAGEAQEPVLPAAAAASRNSYPRSPSAPQRSAAARGSGRQRLGRRHPPLSFPLAFRDAREGEPSLQDPRISMNEGAMASLCSRRVQDGGSESPSLYPLGSLVDPHLLGYLPLRSAAQDDPAPALSQVFHVSVAFASQ